MKDGWVKDLQFGVFMQMRREKAEISRCTIAVALSLADVDILDIENGERPSLGYEQLSLWADCINLDDKDRAEMFDLEGQVNGAIPTDVKRIIACNSAPWTRLARRMVDISLSHTQGVLINTTNIAVRQKAFRLTPEKIQEVLKKNVGVTDMIPLDVQDVMMRSISSWSNLARVTIALPQSQSESILKEVADIVARKKIGLGNSRILEKKKTQVSNI